MTGTLQHACGCLSYRWMKLSLRRRLLQHYAKAGVRTELSAVPLCMGNQARVEPALTVLSTSTRNFPTPFR